MIVYALLGLAACFLGVAQFGHVLPLSYVAIGLALAGLGLLFRSLVGRHRATSDDDTGESPSEEVDEEARDGDEEARPDGDRGAVERPDAFVYVLGGRKRFHRPGCRSLGERTGDELTVDEAEAEGFSPCTLCHIPAATSGGVS